MEIFSACVRPNKAILVLVNSLLTNLSNSRTYQRGNIDHFDFNILLVLAYKVVKDYNITLLKPRLSNIEL